MRSVRSSGRIRATRAPAPGADSSSTSAELDLMLNYAAYHFGNGAARVELRARRREAAGERGAAAESVRSIRQHRHDPARSGDRCRASSACDRARERAGTARRLPVADGAAAAGRVRIGASLSPTRSRRVSFAQGRLTLIYVWNDPMPSRARRCCCRPKIRRGCALTTIDSSQRSPWRRAAFRSLNSWRRFSRLLIERGASGDIVRENRAAILVLALYVNGKGLAEIVAAARQWPRAASRQVTLAGRDDFPKHFLISAAIAAEAGSPLADAIGLQKEIEDARGGSGFSFNDIGADRAGTRFGEVAIVSQRRAAELALAIAAGARESDFMPDVADLPEFMPDAEFKRRYGGIGAPAYNEMMAMIDARVASRPLLR